MQLLANYSYTTRYIRKLNKRGSLITRIHFIFVTRANQMTDHTILEATSYIRYDDMTVLKNGTNFTFRIAILGIVPKRSISCHEIEPFFNTSSRIYMAIINEKDNRKALNCSLCSATF